MPKKYRITYLKFLDSTKCIDNEHDLWFVSLPAEQKPASKPVFKPSFKPKTLENNENVGANSIRSNNENELDLEIKPASKSFFKPTFKPNPKE